jgi:hypothetical protein
VAHRLRFDPKRSLIAARGFTFAGRAYALGDPFPHPEDGPFAQRQIERQYETRAVNFAPESEAAEDPVQMTKAEKNGYYTITAPWFERPLTVRGKVNAEKALAEVREEGAPLGFIDGGTEVEVEESGGGWYQITAPWLDEPEKVQGREAAEARQREIHDAGEPEAHHGVSLTEAESGNGYYEVKADWLAEAEKVHGIDAARERAAELRTEGAPEGWTPEDGPVAPATDGQDAADQADPAEAAAGAQAAAAAQTDPEAHDPASEGADGNAAKADTAEGAEQAAAEDGASDTASDGDGADSAAAGDEAETPAEGEAGKSEDPPATA